MTFAASTDHTHDNDPDAFRAGLDAYLDGSWPTDRWKTFRLRFGIYEQRQAGRHMIRAKIPGGRLSPDQARAIAKANAQYGGGDVHITTRQGVQLYFIDLTDLADLIDTLHAGGVTSREASGNTFRAITACPHAGFCAEQHTDAATVAARLTDTWLRDPLTQHMPRKFKTAVSGCARDCGLGAIDDLAFVATTDDAGRSGFRVLAGGGLGIAPQRAVEVFAFVEEHDLSRVQEAVAKVHIAHSDRTNKNRARLKFLVKRLGVETFKTEVRAAFDALKGLEQPAWQALDWRGFTHTTERVDISVEVPLGWLSSGQLAGLAELLQTSGGRELRLTRRQNIIAVGVCADQVDDFVNGARNLGVDASGRDHTLADLAVCPGTSTCAIGINDSFALGESLLDGAGELPDVPGLRISISGCHNSCAHHHVADIAFHGVAKKIAGRPAPHYQLHVGGGAQDFALSGPVVPARRVKRALALVLAALKEQRRADESVRAWAERIGADGLAAIVHSVTEVKERDTAELQFDIGQDVRFTPPVTATGECAAGAVVAEHMADLAQVARRDARRLWSAGRVSEIDVPLLAALDWPLRRLLTIVERDEADTLRARLDAVRDHWGHDAAVLAALDGAVGAQEPGEADIEPALTVLAHWQRVADGEVERLLSAAASMMPAPLPGPQTHAWAEVS